MFTIYGKVVSVNPDKTSTGKSLVKVQVLSNGFKYHQLYTVSDYDCRNWKVGEDVKIPVTIRAYVGRNNVPGFSLTAQKQG
jgi:hypothetical protein